MDKQKADEIIVEYLPKIYGFAMQKAFYYQEAEELCSDIVEKVYLSLLSAKEIYNTDGYIWRISEHVYSRFVASKKNRVGISIDGMDFPDDSELLDEDPEEELRRLRREIAFLTQKRREIVYSFYYENRPISQIANEMGLPEGTVKWHLNKARNELKKGFTMERKIGKLGMKPIEACGFGHSGTPGKNGGPEYYLEDKLNLNIVYSVYFTPKTKEQIAEELGMPPVFIEDKVKMLEENGFLVRQAGERYTTFVKFDLETYSLEQRDLLIGKKRELAELLVKEYVPAVRRAIADVSDVYIPSGNRELFEAAVIFYAVLNKCDLSVKKDLASYRIQTADGGDYIAYVHLPKTQSDPEYTSIYPNLPPYWACGNMTRWSEKYPSVYSWSVDTRYSSREGAWENNRTADYEYLYEYLTGAITDGCANENKFKRLRQRRYLTDDGKVNIMMVRGEAKAFFKALPSLEESLKRHFADSALEMASMEAKKYPPQMRDLVINWSAGGFVDNMVALMVMDILYENGTFKPLTEQERVSSQLLLFCDVLPQV